MSVLPVTIAGAPLESDFSGTPQELFDAIVARLSLESQESIALVGTGSVLPVSDQGPFLLDGNKWYMWSDDDGAYVPQVIEFKPQLNPKPWRMNMTGDQVIVFAGAGSQEVEIDFTVEYDTDGCCSSSSFVAPDDGFYTFKAKLSLAATTGTPTANIALVYLKKNGFQMAKEQVFEELGDVYSGQTYPISTELKLLAGDVIKLAVGIQTADASTWTVYANDTWLCGHKIRNEDF